MCQSMETLTTWAAWGRSTMHVHTYKIANRAHNSLPYSVLAGAGATVCMPYD